MKSRTLVFTTLFNFFLSLTIKPICLFFEKNNLCSYILIGNRVRIKSLGIAPGLANARLPGRTKFANAPPPGLTRQANAPQ